MSDPEITALAREYAEETVSMRHTTAIVADEAEAVIRFLLRRFSFVEKSKVMQIYQAKQHILANQNVFGITVATEAAAQKRLMLCLFTEIGKEMQP